MQATYSSGDDLSRIQRVAHNRSGLWVAIVITLIGLLLFTGIFNFFLPNLGDELSNGPLILLGLILSAVPAAIWLFFFYRLDRLEPEPKHMVLGIFVLGALAAGALHDPLLNNVFNISNWLYSTWWSHLLGGILVVGFIEQFLIYAVVRYSIFNNPEFDERVDGVIYAIAAGLGLATVLNFQYVVRSNGVDLDIGSIRMVVNAMAYAAFAGIMGYFIGQIRFEKTPIWYMPAGLTLAAVFNGLFFFLLNRTFGRGLDYNPWSDLIFAMIVAAVALGLVFWLVERANEETLRLAHRAVREQVGLSPVPAPATTTQPVVTTTPDNPTTAADTTAAAGGSESTAPDAPSTTASEEENR